MLYISVRLIIIGMSSRDEIPIALVHLVLCRIVKDKGCLRNDAICADAIDTAM